MCTFLQEVDAALNLRAISIIGMKKNQSIKFALLEDSKKRKSDVLGFFQWVAYHVGPKLNFTCLVFLNWLFTFQIERIVLVKGGRSFLSGRLQLYNILDYNNCYTCNITSHLEDKPEFFPTLILMNGEMDFKFHSRALVILVID